MINIVAILGGLGNQMFDYAFFLSLRKKTNKICLIDLDQSVDKHFGLEVFKVFYTKHFYRYKLLVLLKKYFPIIERRKRTIRQTNSLNYDPLIYYNKIKIAYYYGYWQSEKYFKDIEDDIRKVFSFKKELIDQNNINIAEELINTNSISIHVRRGDYLKETGWDTCDINYYQRAIKYIKQRVPDCSFYLFSDDIIWCKEHFLDNNFTYVDWNNGIDSWQDMFLMSQCKHNIIANSTFSWWGAWLNSNTKKIVIAPSVWFKDRDNKECHIIPDNWIKM